MMVVYRVSPAVSRMRIIRDRQSGVYAPTALLLGSSVIPRAPIHKETAGLIAMDEAIEPYLLAL